MKTSSLSWCCLLLLAACASHDDGSKAKDAQSKAAMKAPVAATTTGSTATAPDGTMPASAPRRAVAKLVAASDSNVTGTVTFTQQAGGVEVRAHVEHLTAGKHGFHVHEMGDCSAHDGASAGGHFNPDTKPHGDRLAAERHVGDLGNLVADGSGVADVVFVDTELALSGPHSIVNRSIMVHADPDDGTTQPTGNSGKRIACGVINAEP